MQDIVTIKDRVIEIAKLKNVSLELFFKLLGLNYSNFKGEAKQRALGSDAIGVILKAYPDINPDWLIFGEGDTFRPDPSLNNAELLEIDYQNVMLVPYISNVAYAGYLCGYSNDDFIDNLPKYPVFTNIRNKGKYIVVEISGDSMDDGTSEAFLNKSVVVCREIHPDYWRYEQRLHLRNWSYFVIAHKTEGLILKQIIEHNTTNKTITIHSLNTNYEDQILHLEDISQIFNVVKDIRDR